MFYSIRAPLLSPEGEGYIALLLSKELPPRGAGGGFFGFEDIETNQDFNIKSTEDTVGIIIGRIQYLPFDLDISLVTLPFLYVGINLKDFYAKSDILDKIPAFFIFLIIWASTVAVDYHIDPKHIDLAIRHYPLFPIFYIVTLSGNLCVFYICRQLVKLKISNFLTFVGKNSLYIYIIHYFDQELELYNLVRINGCFLTNGILEILLDISIFLFLTKVISDKYTFLQKTALLVFSINFCREFVVYIKTLSLMQ